MTSVSIKAFAQGAGKGEDLRVKEKPVADGQYIIGSDVAEGATFGTAKRAGDLSTVCILKREGMSLVQVAEGCYRTENFEVGLVIAALGRWYNSAWVNVERNMAHAIMPALKASGYPPERMYVPPIQASTMEQISGNFFFHKNHATQKVLLDTLVAYMDPQAPRLRLFSKRCLAELASLQMDANGRINTNGKDFTIALAMAVIVDATTEFDIELLAPAKKPPAAPWGVDKEQWDLKHGIKQPPRNTDDAPLWDGDDGLDDGVVAWTERLN